MAGVDTLKQQNLQIRPARDRPLSLRIDQHALFSSDQRLGVPLRFRLDLTHPAVVAFPANLLKGCGEWRGIPALRRRIVRLNGMQDPLTSLLWLKKVLSPSGPQVLSGRLALPVAEDAHHGDDDSVVTYPAESISAIPGRNLLTPICWLYDANL